MDLGRVNLLEGESDACGVVLIGTSGEADEGVNDVLVTLPGSGVLSLFCGTVD